MIRWYLSLFIALLPGVFLYSADLASPTASPHRGQLIITEVVLDDDGVYAALPAQGSANGNWKHTAKTDLLIEMKNVSGSAIDLRNFKLVYVIEPYDFGADATLKSTGSVASYDLCGYASNSTHGDNVQINTITGSSAMNVGAGEFVVLHENPHAGGISFLDTDEVYIAANATGSFSGLARHQYPVQATNYPSNGGTQTSYHRIYMSLLDGYLNDTTDESGLTGMLQGIFSTDPEQKGYSLLEIDRGGGRVCVGNLWTTDTNYTGDGWVGAPGDITTVAQTGNYGVPSQRFTLIILDDTDKLVDVFSLSRSITDANAQSDLGPIVNASATLFNFASAGPGMLSTQMAGGASINLSAIGYAKTNLGAATARTSYVTAPISLGAFEESTGTGDNNGNVGSPAFTYDDALSKVQVLRAPPARSHVAGQPNSGAEGDSKSSYRLEVKVIDGSVSNKVQNVLFKIFRVSANTITYGSSFSGLTYNSGTDLWEGTFSPFSLGAGIIATDYGVKLKISDQTGTQTLDMKSSAQVFKTSDVGPIISSFTSSPALNNGTKTDLQMGSTIRVSVNATDYGTAVLKTSYLQLMSDGSAVAGATTYALESAGSNIYTTDYLIPGSTVVTQGTTYYFRFVATDGFDNSTTHDQTNNFIDPQVAPFLNPSPYVISVVQGKTTTIPDLRAVTTLPAAQGGSGAVAYSVKTVGSGLNGCSLDPATGQGNPQKLVIVAGSTPGTAYCTLTLTVPSGQAETNDQVVQVNIIATSDTTLTQFRAAPGLNSNLPSTITSRTRVSFSDFVEFEAKLSDIDGLNTGSVVMHMVVTDPIFVPSTLTSVPTTVYSIYMYDDGFDVRSPSVVGETPIPFGQRYIPATAYTLNDGDRQTVESAITPAVGGQSFPVGGAADFYSFKAGISAPNDSIFHIDIRPFDFAFSTNFRLDLEVTDNNANKTYLADVGRAAIFSGPGWQDPSPGDSNFTIIESSTSQNKTFRLFAYECTAPKNQVSSLCGTSIPSQAVHEGLDWTVESYDTAFYSAVSPTAAVDTQDEFQVSVQAHRCGTGTITMKVTDSQGFSATTNTFSMNVSCVDNAPVYESSYSGGSPTALLVPEDSTLKSFSLTNIGFEVIDGYGETPRTSMRWTAYTSSASVKDSNLVTWFVSGANLFVTPVPNFSHSGTNKEEIVLCLQDSTGNKATNGVLPDPEGTPLTCIIVPLVVSPFDDSPVISTTGMLPVSAILSPMPANEDVTLVTQIGMNDSDGPIASTAWTATTITDPNNVVRSISFAQKATIGTTGQTWDMTVVPHPNKFGLATFRISVATNPSATASQIVTFNFQEVNDPFTFTGTPCPVNQMSQDENFPETNIALNEAIINDVDSTSPGEDYFWSLTRVDYEGNYFDDSQSQTVFSSGTFSANNSNSLVLVDGSSKALFNVQVKSEGVLRLQAVTNASVVSATIHMSVKDRNGGANFTETFTSCKLVIRDSINTPVIDNTINSSPFLFTEDQTYAIDLGQYEKDPNNPLTATFDSNLQWSVRLGANTTMFSVPVSYPATFSAYLNQRNNALGYNKKIALGPNNPSVDDTSTGPGSIATMGGTPTFLDPTLDMLYIRTAPDVYGQFQLELNLHRSDKIGEVPPATKTLAVTVTPVNDPPEITILDGTQTMDSDFTFVMNENDSVKYLTLTTWENDARDWQGVFPGKNSGPDTPLFWDYQNFSTSDPETYLLGCPSLSTNFLDPVTNDILCLRPGSGTESVNFKTANLVLKLRDFDGIANTERIITVQVNGGNDHPIIKNLSNVVISEDVPEFKIELINRTVDAEEALLSFDDGTGNIVSSLSLMEWFFSPTSYGPQFSVTQLTNTTFLTTSTSLGNFTIDSAKQTLTMTPSANVTGSLLMNMVLCDRGTPFGSLAKLCTSTPVTFVVSDVNDLPLASFPTSVFSTNEGSCHSVDLSQYVTDFDGDSVTWEILTGSITPVTFDTNLFPTPDLRIAPDGTTFEMFPSGATGAGCSASTSSKRAFGSLTMTLVAKDGIASKHYGQIVSFLPVWTSPSIDLKDHLASGTWTVDEDSTTAVATTSYNLERNPRLIDNDWGGVPPGFGETLTDFNWSISYQSLTTTHYVTSAFELKILTGTPPNFEDVIQFLPIANKSTTGVTVTLTVTDSQGLVDQKLITLVVAEKNDPPSWINFPTPGACQIAGKPSGLTSSALCLFEDSSILPIDLTTHSGDPFDNPPNALDWNFDYSQIGNPSSTPCASNLTKVVDTGVFRAVVDGAQKQLTIQGLPNKNHDSLPFGRVLTMCLSDGGTPVPTQVTVYVKSVNDNPRIATPTASSSFVIPEDQSVEITISGNDSDDGDSTFDSSHLTWVAEFVGAGTRRFTVSPLDNKMVVSPDSGYNSQVPQLWRLTLKESDTPEKLSTSVQFQLSATPVNDPPFIQVVGGGSTISLAAVEDTSPSFTLKDYVTVTDEEGVSTHSWSFNATTNSFLETFNTPNGDAVSFQLLNASDINNLSQLSVTPLTSNATGTINGVEIYIRDLSEPSRVLTDSVKVDFQFIGVNDPPVIDLKADQQRIKVITDSTQATELNLSNSKKDADTAQNQLCFEVGAYDSLKIQASMRSGYGPAIAGQNNCTDDRLLVFPVFGQTGSTPLELILFDTKDLLNRSATIEVELVSSKPRILTEKLSRSALTFTTDVNFSIAANEELVADDTAIANTAFQTGIGGFLLRNSGVAKLFDARINSNQLIVDPDYTEPFKDGSGTFTLEYLDSQGNSSGEVTLTVTKKHGFLEWARFNDVDGSRSFNGGDQVVLKFSDTSEGVIGVSPVTPTSGSTPLALLKTSNLLNAIKPMVGNQETLTGFGSQVRRLDFFDSSFRRNPNTGVYLSITMNEDLNPALDGIRASHVSTISGQGTTWSLVLGSLIPGSTRKVSLSTASDEIPPRLEAGYLVDTDNTGLGSFAAGDQIQLYFSEYLANLVSGDTVADSFLVENMVVGTNPSLSLERNRVTITLGQGANIVPAFVPAVQALNSIADLQGNAISSTRNRVLLQTNDDLGPIVLKIEYDKKSVGANLYRTGDQIYIVFDGAILTSSVPVTNANNELDAAFGLDGVVRSFGSGASIQWVDGNKVLIITLGANTTGLSSVVKLVPAQTIKDQKGNSVGAGQPLAESGLFLPANDTLAPTVRLEFYRNGAILSEDQRQAVGPGPLDIRAIFSDTQNTAPRIRIFQGSITYADSAMTILSGDASGRQFQFSHTVVKEDGQSFFDGTHQLEVTGEADPFSAKPLEMLNPKDFKVDSKGPVLGLNPFGILENIGGVNKRTTEDENITITGTSSEKLIGFQVRMISPVSGVSAIQDLQQNGLDFQIRLFGLQSGDNIFQIIGTDLAGNVSQVENAVYRKGGDGTQVPTDPVDIDSDGVINFEDAFPSNPAEQYDTDGDGQGDNEDTDDDGDGILDLAEREVIFRSAITDMSLDSDNDGLPNLFDTDDDADGIPDKREIGYVNEFKVAGRVLDTDNDGVPNHSDTDDDNDGLSDIQERSLGTNVFDPDTDGDGFSDGQDAGPLDPFVPNNVIPASVPISCRATHSGNPVDLDADGLANVEDPFPRDHDNDGTPDHLDCDDDGDNIQDGEDQILVVSLQDYDGDGRLNTVDEFPCDFNNDGTPESSFGGNQPLSLVLDQDNDCITDSEDEDRDGDGIPDDLEGVLDDDPNDGPLEAAVPRGANNKPMVRIPPAGLTSTVVYDTRALSDEYKEIGTLTLEPDPDLVEIVPVIQVKNSEQTKLGLAIPGNFSPLGKVLNIKGKIKPNSVVKFPFPLPSFLKNDNTLASSDLRLEFFDEDPLNPGQGTWRQSGANYTMVPGQAVLYADITHFSQWRVLRSNSSVFNGGTLASAAGGGGGGGGCFIVTAASGEGSYLVNFFKNWRDKFLLSYDWGRVLMDFYYTYSPSVAAVIEASNFLKLLTQSLLWFLVLLIIGLQNIWLILGIAFLLKIALKRRVL